MNPTTDPLAALEAGLRLADAAGEPVTFGRLASIVREARAPTSCQRCAGTGSVPERTPVGIGLVPCDACEGTGRTEAAPEPTSCTCPECEGLGAVREYEPDGVTFTNTTCARCEGTGVRP